MTGICPEGSSALVYPNNMGLVSLNRDGSVEHRLLTEFPGQEQVFLVHRKRGAEMVPCSLAQVKCFHGEDNGCHGKEQAVL